jgi:hypothetical protein
MLLRFLELNDMIWRQRELETRFPQRPHLTKSQLAAEYFSELPITCVLEALELLEREFRIDAGFLRPDDSLIALFAPVRTWNPLRWLFLRGLESDGVAEIEHQLARKRESLQRAQITRGDVRSFGDFVRSWCGH